MGKNIRSLVIQGILEFKLMICSSPFGFYTFFKKKKNSFSLFLIMYIGISLIKLVDLPGPLKDRLISNSVP